MKNKIITFINIIFLCILIASLYFNHYAMNKYIELDDKYIDLKRKHKKLKNTFDLSYCYIVERYKDMLKKSNSQKNPTL